MPQAELDHLTLCYERRSGTGIPLMLIGGLACQLVNFPVPILNRFIDAGVNPIRVDLRDAGRSTHFPAGPDYTLYDCADDLIALADYLNVDRFHIAGAGFGGLVAQVAALRYPERIVSLTSINSFTAEDGEPIAFESRVADRLSAVISRSPDRQVQRRRYLSYARAVADDESVSIHELERFVDRLIERDSTFDGTSRFFGSVASTPPWADEIRAIEMPVLVLHGKRDPFCRISGGRRTAALIPHAKFIAIDGMSHYLSTTFWNVALDEIVQHVAAAERGASQ